jgi:hypothetical protein
MNLNKDTQKTTSDQKESGKVDFIALWKQAEEEYKLECQKLDEFSQINTSKLNTVVFSI